MRFRSPLSRASALFWASALKRPTFSSRPSISFEVIRVPV